MSAWTLEHKFCSECGKAFPQTEKWPRVCSCGKMKFQNPIPVALVLQPVEREEENGAIRRGLAIAKRNIDPGKGQWALIGGFLDGTDSSAELGAQREFWEETKLHSPCMPRVVYTRVTPSKQLLIVCVVDKALTFEEYLKGKCCPENQELGVLWSYNQLELAFPLHREAAIRFFHGEFNTCPR